MRTVPQPPALVSATLVEDGFAWVTRHLADEHWLGSHRKLDGQLSYARWDLGGNNFMLLDEMAQLRGKIAEQGWRSVSVRPLFHSPHTNWTVCVTYAPCAQN